MKDEENENCGVLPASKQKTLKGVTWSAVETFSVQGIQFILGLFIARWVAPAEYGLIAMVGVFFNIAQVFIDGGFSTVLIQKQNRTKVDFSTVFYLNITVAVVCYILIFFSSSYIALFYKEDRLMLITKYVGVNIIISSFSIVQRTILMIDLNFKALAKVSLISSLISGCFGVLLAYHGLGIIALIAQSIISNLLNSILLWVTSKWRPLLVFSRRSASNLLGFSLKMLLSNLLLVIHANLYSLVIGLRYSAANVGFYNRAYQLAYFPSVNITNIVARAIYPVQCQLQKEEKTLSSFFVANIRWLCLLVFPLMVGLSVLVKPIIILLLTEKWLFAAELSSLLCIAYMWYPVMMLNSQILKVMGYPNYYLKSEIIRKMIAISILIISLPIGLHGICYGLILFNMIDAVIAIYFTKKVLNIGYVKQFRNIYPFLFLSLIMAGGMFLCQLIIKDNQLLQLICLPIVGLSIYLLLGVLLKINEFKQILVRAISLINYFF